MALEQDKKQDLDVPFSRGGAPRVVCDFLPKATPIAKLRKKSDFAKVACGKKAFAPSLMIQAAPFEGQAEEQPVRVGFIASKKVGSAVRRNRAKRKMRVLAKEVLGVRAKKGWDYVLIAHPSLVAKNYACLKKELEQVLEKITQKMARS